MPACGSWSTTGPTFRSGAELWTGNSRACRCGSNSAPATSPPGRPRSPTGSPEGRSRSPLTTIAETVVALLGREQQTMLDNARAARDARIADVATVADAVAACAQGWARLPSRTVGEAGEDELA